MHESESEVAQSCLTLSDPMDCSLPGSSVRGIFQTRVLEWVAIAFSLLALAINKFTLNKKKSHSILLLYSIGQNNLISEVAQSYLTLCDPMDCSLPGSSVHGIFQARVREWVAISFANA